VIEPQFALGDHYLIQPYFGGGKALFGNFTSQSNLQTGLKFLINIELSYLNPFK
jgi:hypothetical protein